MTKKRKKDKEDAVPESGKLKKLKPLPQGKGEDEVESVHVKEKQLLVNKRETYTASNKPEVYRALDQIRDKDSDLIIASHEIDDEELTALVQALKVNKKLKSLDISDSTLRENLDIKPLIEALRVSSLTSLNISNDKIDSKEFELLTNILISGKSVLTDLNVSNNNEIEDTSGLGLPEALEVNRTLRSLNLSNHSELSDGEAEFIAKALSVNRTLTRLNLMNTPIGAIGAKALVNMLKDNHTLVDLSIGYEEVDFDTTDSVEPYKPELSLLLLRNAQLITKVVQKLNSLKLDSEYVEDYRPYLKHYLICNETILGTAVKTYASESFYNNTNLYIAGHYFKYAGIINSYGFHQSLAEQNKDGIFWITLPKVLVNKVVEFLGKDSLWLPAVEEEGSGGSHSSSSFSSSSSSSSDLAGDHMDTT